jgi:hypothetical protein
MKKKNHREVEDVQGRRSEKGRAKKFHFLYLFYFCDFAVKIFELVIRTV